MPLDQMDDNLLLPPGETTGMPLGDHIEELRTRLIRAMIGVLIALVVTFYFGFDIIAWIAQPLLQVQSALGYPPQTIATDPTAGFMSVYLKVSLIAAIILASPWVIYQIWLFIVSGLYDKEKRAVYILAPFSTIMTVLAVAFTYYVLLPIGLVFFLKFATYYPSVQGSDPNWLVTALTDGFLETPEPTISEDAKPLQLPVFAADPPAEQLADGMLWIDAERAQIKSYLGGQVRTVNLMASRIVAPMPEVGQYVRFAAMTGLGIVIAFQMPVVMLVMGWTQLVSPKWIGKSRKYAFFACFAAGAVLTPNDVMTMFVLAVPLYLLFEFGLALMRMVYREPEMPEEL